MCNHQYLPIKTNQPQAMVFRGFRFISYRNQAGFPGERAAEPIGGGLDSQTEAKTHVRSSAHVLTANLATHQESNLAASQSKPHWGLLTTDTTVICGNLFLCARVCVCVSDRV